MFQIGVEWIWFFLFQCCRQFQLQERLFVLSLDGSELGEAEFRDTLIEHATGFRVFFIDGYGMT